MPLKDNKTQEEYITHGDVIEALYDTTKNLYNFECPNKDSAENYDNIEWATENPDPKPSKKVVEAKFQELKKDFEDKVYIRARQKEYPDAPTQLAYIYDHGIEKWRKDMIDPIKKRHPKKSAGSKK